MQETPLIPETMTAIGIEAPGGPEALVAMARPVPRPGDGEILVKVAAAGVNRPDVLQRQGAYPPPAGASDILGLEFAGHVVALGAGAQRWAVGDAVTALVPGGGYAEYACVNAANALPVPGSLTMVECAALPETVFTVWHNVFERGRLTAGETLLVHGGTSGIGTTAIQLGKAFGARVITTVGSAEKCRAALALGADVAINYREADFAVAVKEATEGRGANVILDMVGGPYVERNLDAAAVDGRIVQIAFLEGARVTVDLRRIMMKRLTYTGSTLRARAVADKAAMAQAIEAKIWPLIVAGRFKPPIDSTYPLAEAARAHARMETSAHIGKIVLVT